MYNGSIMRIINREEFLKLPKGTVYCNMNR